MSTLFEEDDREEAKQDADLTLGIGSLLSIFFGIVLICGIFFGFGYSMGRRNAHPAESQPAPAPTETAETTATPSPAVSTPAVTSPADTSAANGSPSADTSQAELQKASSAPASSADNTPKSEAIRAATAPVLSTVPALRRAPAVSHQHMGIKAPLEQAEGDSALTPGHPIMVQIAAISRRGDADVLANALRQRGFTPTVHPGTADHLFHVQVGPFSTKAQAESVKQRLLSDGYNAILK